SSAAPCSISLRRSLRRSPSSPGSSSRPGTLSTSRSGRAGTGDTAGPATPAASLHPSRGSSGQGRRRRGFGGGGVAGERSRGRQYETDMVQPEEGAFLWAFLARPDQAGPPFTHTLVLPEPDEEGYWPEPGPAYTMTDCEPKGDEPSVSPP